MPSSDRGGCAATSPTSRSHAEVLDAVLATAFRGPTAGNTNMLDLVVLTGADTDRYWDVTLAAGAPRCTFRWPGLLRAPVLVLPVVNPAAYVDRYSEPDKAHTGLGASADDWEVPYWWVDGGAAVMAMLLAAERHGLGALLFGQMTHESDGGRRALGIPDGRRSVGTVALGHPADRRSPGPGIGASGTSRSFGLHSSKRLVGSHATPGISQATGDVALGGGAQPNDAAILVLASGQPRPGTPASSPRSGSSSPS